MAGVGARTTNDCPNPSLERKFEGRVCVLPHIVLLVAKVAKVRIAT